MAGGRWDSWGGPLSRPPVGFCPGCWLLRHFVHLAIRGTCNVWFGQQAIGVEVMSFLFSCLCGIVVVSAWMVDVGQFLERGVDLCVRYEEVVIY